MAMIKGGVVGLDADRNVVMINAAARRMLGDVDRSMPFPWPAHIRFLNYTDSMPLDQTENPLNRAFGHKPLAGELFLISRTARHQEPRPVRLISTVLEMVGGGSKALIMLEDIREDATGERTGVTTHHMDVFSELTHGITNDFNNALATIAYAIDLSLKQSLPDKATSLLLTALTTVEKGQSLTRKMMLLGRQKNGQVSSRSVLSMLEDFQMMVPSTIGDNVSLTVTCDEPGLLIRCNQAQLENVLLTLVLNGADAILRGSDFGSITVSAKLADVSDSVMQLRELHSIQSEFVELIVSDDGPGMPESTSSQISNPFVLSKDRHPDIGKGLSEVQAFVIEAGGHLRVEANKPRGTSVCLMLPLVHETMRTQTNLKAPLLKGGGETVLVVEDDAMVLLMLQEVLEELGYRVISATSGRAAVGLVEQGVEFDLIITDIIMPGDIDGFDLVRQVRLLRDSIAVLYISGSTDVLSGTMGSIDAPILKKPCLANELANAVTAVLSKRLA